MSFTTSRLRNSKVTVETTFQLACHSQRISQIEWRPLQKRITVEAAQCDHFGEDSN